MRNSRSIFTQNVQTGKKKICITVVVLGIIIGSILFAYKSFASTAHDETLQQVIILFRHGDRNPTETYPNDPYINYPWEGGWGALTKKGMLRMYRLGQWIRKQYGGINKYKYTASNTLVQSSYADRCIMSAQALLAGLYPPSIEEAFVSDLLWRPIPVHYTSRNMDKIIVVKAPCPKLEQELRAAYANESKNSSEELKLYYKELSKHTGQFMNTITDIEFLYNTLEIEKLHGLQLPDWTKRFYNDKMREIAAKSMAIFTSNTLQKRLRGGPLLKNIVTHMDDFRNGKDMQKMHLYGVHDITLVNLLRTMGITKYMNKLLKPGYGATVIFELRKNENNPFEVKVFYIDDSNFMELNPLSIPVCTEYCSLDKLIYGYEEIIPENWDFECTST